LDPLTQLTLIASNIIFLLKMNYLLLSFLWLLIIFLDIVWSGLSKAIRLLMFPGVLLRTGVILLAVSKSGQKFMPYGLLRMYYSRASIVVKFNAPIEVFKLVIYQFITAILGSFASFYISDFVSNTVTKIILIWIGVSIFVSNLPNSTDIEALILSIWGNEPISAIAMFLSLVILPLGLELFGITISILLTLLYLLLVLVLTPLNKRYTGQLGSESKESLILDEES